MAALVSKVPLQKSLRCILWGLDGQYTLPAISFTERGKTFDESVGILPKKVLNVKVSDTPQESEGQKAMLVAIQLAHPN